jgi:DNA polymerase elongation subunit (family B)
VNIECHDLGWRSEDGALFLEALTSDSGEKRVDRVPAPFDPYCYIREEDLTMDPLRVTGCRLDADAPEGFLRVVADHPSAIYDFKDRFAFETFEADVDYATRCAIDESVAFAPPDPEDVLYFDIEVDDRFGFAQPEDADERVLSIAAVGGDGEEYYFDDENEWSLLNQFLMAADGYVALVGWNSLDYDFRYLKNRLGGMGRTVHWERWLRLDLMPLYDMLAVPTKTVSTKLDDTGEREVGMGKADDDVEPGDGRLYEAWSGGDPALREYNIRDCEIVKRVDEKYSLVELLATICDLCNYPPGDACYLTKHGQVRFAIGQVVDAKLLEVARRKGIPQRNKRSATKPPDFPGGYVLEPVPGLYEWLMAPDYSGMYPNIVRSWNFGAETFVKEEHCVNVGGEQGWTASGGPWQGHRVIKGETGGFVHPDDGVRSVPAEAADELVEMRDGAKDIVDKGVKSVNNTLYGVFASDFHRYFGEHSENITLIGQKLTGTVERIANEGHPDIRDVVYGDTDSVMIDMEVPDDITVEEAVEVARGVSDDIEREMQEWARGRGALAEHLELDLDDVYDRYYIGDKKKRYFGHRVFDGEMCDNFKMRGFEARQNDWPEPCRDMQEELMHAVLDDEPTRPIIDRYKEALFRGEFDLDMATSTKLGQPHHEYDPPMPHSRAAEALVEEFGSGAVQVGDKVDYIKFGPGKRDVAWLHRGEIGAIARDEPLRPSEGWCDECGEVVVREGHPHETAEHPRLRDQHYSFLWEKKFVSVMGSIGVTEFEQSGLADFA